ncbi:MAG: outer membrane protein assembly factor BamD [Hyphomicrobiaceae bacterium]
MAAQIETAAHATFAGLAHRAASVWLALLSACAAVGMAAPPVQAEPVLDRGLSGTQVAGDRNCMLVKIEFNFRVRYASHFPLERGDDLQIAVRAIDPAQASSLALLRREALRPPASASSSIRVIELETNVPNGPLLHVRFAKSVNFAVGQGPNFDSIVIAIGKGAGSKRCMAIFPKNEWETSLTIGPRSQPSSSSGKPAGRGTRKADAATFRSLEAALDEGRAALRRKKYEEAKKKFKSVLRYAENKASPEAHEMLALAYEKSGDFGQARAEYEDFIRRYPSGEGYDRVTQRLAGVRAKLGDIPTQRFAGDSSPKQFRKFAPSNRESWSVSGSVSQFYIRDDSYRVVRDPSLPPEIIKDLDDHRIHQNQVLSSFDLIAAWNNAAFKSKFRFTGSEEHGFADDGSDLFSAASLYAETTYIPWGLMGRVGRQTRYTSGVLGRFDGGLVSWQSTPWMRINVVAGSPVARRKDGFFKDQKSFYGASIDFGPIFGGFEASLFAIEQRDDNYLDRQAFGTELRYIDSKKSAFLTVDYDTHFQQLNAAIASGSYRFEDKSTINAGVDYRKSPYLSAWTALQGQPFLTLYDMLKLRTKEEVDQLAIDRTPTYKSATVGYSRPLNDHLQINVDATVTNVTGTVTSGGITGLPGTGNEYYYSGQLIGTSMIENGDLYIAGIRVADRADSNLYVLDLTARYPIMSNLISVSPRLRLGYRLGDASDLVEYSALPSLQLNYYWTRDFSFELEAGARWTSTRHGNTSEDNTELLFTAGFRYDFFTDDQSKCKPIAVNCR